MRRKPGLKKTKLASFDKHLFVTTLILVILGLVAVADASAPQAMDSFSDKYFFFKQQSIWALLGVVVMFAVSFVNYKFWGKIAVPAFFVSIILLIVVLIPGMGLKTYGARRWISLGFTTFQPSELAKIAFVLYFAKLSSSQKSLISYTIPLGVLALLVMFQPDLGTTLVLVGTGMIQIFVSGVNLWHFFGVGIFGTLSAGALIFFSDYRKDRLMTFVNQTTDPLGKGYHIRQILMALGSGGVFGVGIGASRQKYLFLPEAATDSIFAVIAEEVGFTGSLIVIFLLLYFVSRAFAISVKAPDDFAKSLSVGIASWIGLQIFINLASMTALVPLTGIPLPFLSFGGTSLVMILVSTGILLNISRYAQKKRRR